MAEYRVKFYSEHDMSVGQHLQKIEEYLETWPEEDARRTVDDVLELYNIKHFFEAGLHLKKWDGKCIDGYMPKISQIPSIIGKFCATLSDDNFIEVYRDISREYRSDFWKVMSEFRVYKRISPTSLDLLFSAEPNALWHALHEKDIVRFFGQIISEHLTKNDLSAEWLISQFLAEQKSGKRNMYFPEEFSQDLRTRALYAYVEKENLNSNYLQLLANAQNTREFPVDDRLRLKALKKCDAIRENLFAKNPGMSCAVEVSFKSIPNGDVEFSMHDCAHCLAYSHEWIEENQDYPTLLNNFIYLFGYVDRAGRCSFVSLKNEMGVIERNMGIHGKKDYVYGVAFTVKDMQSTLQMGAYLKELKKYGIRVEDLIKWFFESYINDEFGAKGFYYSPPSEGTTYAEKCKLIAISIDGLLKQYRLYVEDGFVDRELLQISSGHVVFGDLKSLRQKKYAYIGSSEFTKEAFLLYSNQSLMTYTEKTKEKYETLPKMLLNERLTIDDFQDFQKRDLQWLIERGTVLIDTEGCLNINKFRALVLQELYQKEVLCPNSFDDSLRKELDILVSLGDLRYENTLFSQPEQDYLNYMLNKSEFSNGLDLRNKYSHDTCSLEESIQLHDYLELLKILILVVLKINDELWSKFPKKC